MFLDRAETPLGPLHGPLTIGFGSVKNVRDEKNKRVAVAGIGPELGIGWVLDDIEQYVLGYDKSQGYELAGFIWFQGWNDGVGDLHLNKLRQTRTAGG